jgi:hypothetical protein
LAALARLRWGRLFETLAAAWRREETLNNKANQPDSGHCGAAYEGSRYFPFQMKPKEMEIISNDQQPNASGVPLQES